ncbi:MAG: lysozyme inhibitor LprI family protein [Chthoniobacterales bacterium]
MKTAAILAIALAAFTLPAIAQTQVEMTDEAAADFKKSDAKLNAAYKKLRATLDEDGQAKLKTAQKAWLAYRDAEAALEAAPNEGGTIYPMVFANVKTRLTDARTEELDAIINSDDEKDDADTDANGNAYTGEQNPDGADDPNQ